MSFLPRYYFNAAENKCKMFLYSGCGGNKNNFRTQNVCENKCKGMLMKTTYIAKIARLS